jgi:cytochrome c-type biogenesis protein
LGSGIDTTVFAAFAAGFVSFISPCVLPLVPGYLSAVSGVSVADLQERRQTSQVLLPAIVFCLSFSAVFIALGMAATGLGQTLRDHQQLLEHIAGALIIAMGVFFISTLFVTRLNQEWHPNALLAKAGSGGGPFVAGAAFAIGWTPCIGPTLTAILNAAAIKDTLAEGAILLAIYSAGLAIPFLLCAVAFHRATTVFRWLRDHYVVITAASGVLLIAMGWLVFTGELADLNVEAQRFLEGLGLDGLYEL